MQIGDMGNMANMFYHFNSFLFHSSFTTSQGHFLDFDIYIRHFSVLNNHYKSLMQIPTSNSARCFLFAGWFYHFSTVLVYCNSCINPFIYAAKYAEFQNGVRRMMAHLRERMYERKKEKKKERKQVNE